jgi:hypothetical protein
MKLDKKYFDCRLIDLLNCFSFRKHLNPEPNDGYKPELDILKQIARDAAEAQRKLSATMARSTYYNPPPMTDKFLIDEIIEVIHAAALAIPDGE